MSQQLDIREFRQALGTFMTGVTVVTTINERGDPIGFTANSFTSVSLDPPLVLACLAKKSGNCESFAKGKSYAINILAENQENVSGVFASPIADRFAQVEWHKEITGSPIIDNVAAWLDCDMHEVVDAGDHLIFIGNVKAFGHSDQSPLGYLRGNYVRFSLGQEAAMAMENPEQKTSFGAFIENKRKIFLLDGEQGLHLPHAPRLGNDKDESSLLGTLEKLGLHTDTHYLFAVFENKTTNVLSIYYRVLIEDVDNLTDGAFYPFSEIPFENVSDELTTMMLERYIRERERDTFGIYIGDETKGAVEPLDHSS